MKLFVTKLTVLLALSASANAYEINNHADISQAALLKSKLNNDSSSGTLARLGLKPLDLLNTRQTFPLSTDPGAAFRALGPIPYCFGSRRPQPWKVTIPLGSENYPGQLPGRAQPAWLAGIGTRLTIAELIRYGACYEDEDAARKRPVAHFYNVQNNGAGSAAGPSSLHWTLRPGSGNPITGGNHFTYQDARDYFHFALTDNDITNEFASREQRATYWARTFQAIGHVIHHVQDMASPQHVRGDEHCNSDLCKPLLFYAPSGYELHFELKDNGKFVSDLASNTKGTWMFPMVHQFWNVNSDRALVTTNPTRPMEKHEGLAAYTSTHYPSAGKDFQVKKVGLLSGAITYEPAEGIPLPRPSGTWRNRKTVSALLPDDPQRAKRLVEGGCKGQGDKCFIDFMGTEQNPDALSSSSSLFSQALLRPEGTYGVEFKEFPIFQQNVFTYEDAAKTLVPLATQYSVGMIDYFFRGELEVLPPANGLYTIADLNDNRVSCANSNCGFKALRARVRNKTPLIVDPSSGQGVEQAAGNGQLVAVVKYNVNRCYSPDGTGEPGPLNPSFDVRRCLFSGDDPAKAETLPTDLHAVSAPLAVPQGLVSSGELNPPELRFDFSAQPIPVNAWNLRLQIVFRGVLGIEADGIAVGLTRIPAPSTFRVFNESDWFLAKRLPEPAPPAQPIAELIKVSDLAATPQKAAISTTVFPDGTTRYGGHCIDDVTAASAPAGSPRQYALKPYVKANSFSIQLRVSSSNQPTRTLATVEIPADGVVSYAAILGANVTLTTFTQQSNVRIETTVGGVPQTNGPEDWTLFESAQSQTGREWLFDETNPTLANRLTLPKHLKSYRGLQFTDAVSRNGWLFSGCPSRGQYYVNQNPIQPFGFTIDAAAFSNRPPPANKVTLGAINF
jgi:hypothetical protein